MYQKTISFVSSQDSAEVYDICHFYRNSPSLRCLDQKFEKRTFISKMYLNNHTCVASTQRTIVAKCNYQLTWIQIHGAIVPREVIQ